MDKINEFDINYDIENTENPDGNKELSSSVLQQQEIDKGQQKIEKLKNENARMQNDTAERKTFACGVRVVICVGLTFTAVVVIGYGLGGLDRLLSNSVIICTLLGTTTANVLGLGYILLKGLFPDGKNNK